MKKSVVLLVIITLFTFKGFGQLLEPVRWSYTAKKTSKNEASVYITATLDKGWHLYSQYVKPGGPQPTKFKFEKSGTYDLIGNTIEPTPTVRLEPEFMMEVGYFETSVIFQQKIKLKGKKATVKGAVKFMVCNDDQCLPPEEVKFTVEVP